MDVLLESLVLEYRELSELSVVLLSLVVVVLVELLVLLPPLFPVESEGVAETPVGFMNGGKLILEEFVEKPEPEQPTIPEEPENPTEPENPDQLTAIHKSNWCFFPAYRF